MGVEDVAGFTAAVSGLLADPDERQALGDRGQRVYDERFSVQRLVDVLRAA
jgi:hypothetical protein